MKHLWFAAAVAAIAIILGAAPSWAQNAYITNSNSNDVSVIATSSYAATAIVPSPAIDNQPLGVAVAPDGSKVYVTNSGSTSTIPVINLPTDTVDTFLSIDNGTSGIAVSPDGSKVYVANTIASNVSVIATLTNTVTATIPPGLLHMPSACLSSLLSRQTRSPGRLGAANAMARVSRRLPRSSETSMPPPKHWGSPA